MNELSELGAKGLIEKAAARAEAATRAFDNDMDKSGERYLGELSGMRNVSIWTMDEESDAYQAIEAAYYKAIDAFDAFHDRHRRA